MNYEIFQEIQTDWELIWQEGKLDVNEFNSRINKDHIDAFQVGKCYYFLLDLQKLNFIYVHPDIKNVLGYDAEMVTFNFFLSKIHPDDQPIFLNHENTVVSFFSKLPADKFFKYKVAYDYRVMDVNGNYVRIYHQVVIVKNDQKTKFATIGIHTDITHLKSTNKSTLSFIGLKNEPSFYNVEVKDVYMPSLIQLTKKEKQVVMLIMKGMSSKQIAETLFISIQTVATHRKNILKKTKTKTAIELQNKVINEGLL